MCLIPGVVSGPGGVPGLGGAYLVPAGVPGPGGCTLSQVVYLVLGVYLVPGGIPGPRGVPAQVLPPCGQTDTCKNITFGNFVWGGNNYKYLLTHHHSH